MPLFIWQVMSSCCWYVMFSANGKFQFMSHSLAFEAGLEQPLVFDSSIDYFNSNFKTSYIQGYQLHDYFPHPGFR
jgi:hypothetical protein